MDPEKALKLSQILSAGGMELGDEELAFDKKCKYSQ